MALTIFFELGIGMVITQFYSHESAYFKLCNNGELQGSQSHIDRFRSLLQQALKWYCGMGFLIVIFIGTAGTIFFGRKSSADVHWIIAWWGYVILTAVSVAVQPFISAIEGLGLISQAQKLRVLPNVVGSIILWACLLSRGQLLATWCLPFAVLVCSSIILIFQYRRLIVNLMSRSPAAQEINWRDEIWPMQWRIALSWVGGYFIFQVFTPILFYFHGPTIAGQMGMTMAIALAISSAGIVPVFVRAPLFAQLVSRRDYGELDRFFYQSSRLAAVLSGVAVVGGLLTVLYIKSLPHYGGRLLPYWQVVLIVITCSVSNITNAQCVYLRAHKMEPFVIALTTVGIFIALAALLLGIRYSSAGQCIAYACITLFISIPWTTSVFLRCRSEWHRPVETILKPSGKLSL